MGVNRLNALIFISRQAVRSCLGALFAKRVQTSRAPEIDAHWSVVFGKLDENGAFPTLCSPAYFAKNFIPYSGLPGMQIRFLHPVYLLNYLIACHRKSFLSKTLLSKFSPTFPGLIFLQNNELFFKFFLQLSKNWFYDDTSKMHGSLLYRFSLVLAYLGRNFETKVGDERAVT